MRKTITTAKISKGKGKLVSDNLSPSSGKAHNCASLSPEQIEMRKRMEHIMEHAETLSAIEKETAYKQPLEPFKHSCLDRLSASNMDNTSSEDNENSPTNSNHVKTAHGEETTFTDDEQIPSLSSPNGFNLKYPAS